MHHCRRALTSVLLLAAMAAYSKYTTLELSSRGQSGGEPSWLELGSRTFMYSDYYYIKSTPPSGFGIILF